MRDRSWVVWGLAVSLASLASACAGDDVAPAAAVSAAGSAGESASSGGSAGVGGGAGGQTGSPTDAASGTSTPDVSPAPEEASSPGTEASTSTSDARSESDVGAQAPCTTAGTELCDDFESGQIDSKKWKVNKPSGSAAVTVDGVHVHGGQYALHVKVVPGQQSTAQVSETVTFPAKSNAFYTRIFAYFSPDLPMTVPAGDFHMGFIITGGSNNVSHVDMAMGSAGDKQYLGYSIYSGPPKVEFGPRSPTKIVPNQWLCLELFESGEGGMSAVRQMWVDGTELKEQKNTFSDLKPPQLDVVSVGLWQYHPTPALSDMWIDDVRVSSQRIGCDP